MKHPKTTPPRPYTPKKKQPAPFLAPAIEKAATGGGAIFREDLEKTLMELYTRSFPGYAKLAKTPSPAIRHSWPPAPYGTLMVGLTRKKSGMSLGNGQVYSFEDDTIDTEDNWVKDTE